MRAKHKSQAEILYQLGYGFRRLHKNVPGGIYECNSRVVQNGIIAQLQVNHSIDKTLFFKENLFV
jgi:histone-lysine N-methyltransferase SETDB1